MSWLSSMFSWNKPKGDVQSIPKPVTPKDPEAPIKSLMRNAPQSTGNANIDANMKLKRELLGGFKKGGKVKKTGLYKVHKGEEVIPKKKAMSKRMTWADLSDHDREMLMDAGHYGPHFH